MSLINFFFRDPPMGMNARNYYIHRVNSLESLKLAKDKARFKRLLAESGLLVPHTYYEIGNYYELPPVDFLPAEFVVKPNGGLGGNGILVLKKEREFFVTSSHEEFSVRRILRHIRKILDGEFSSQSEKDLALIEERIYPSKKLLFRDAAGLPDIRIFCHEFTPVMAMFRYSTKQSKGLANLSQGAIGMGVDLGSGRITHIHSKKEKTSFTLEDFDIPSSFSVPNWEEVKLIAGKAAEISQLRFSGVDIVLDSRDRVLVLEINGLPGLEIQNVNELSLLESAHISFSHRHDRDWE
jgi:alpha-L-glutamate ligase-like protein